MLLPESERGSVILGVAAHYSRHVNAFDRFLYDSTKPAKFLEKIREDFQIAASGAMPDIPEREMADAYYRAELLNFLDFTRAFFLYEEHLRDAGLAQGVAPHSLVFNTSDPRVDRAAQDVTDYYESGWGIRADLLDDTFVRDHPLYKDIARWRRDGLDVQSEMLKAHPELARIIYPGGEVTWATGDSVEIKAVHADILAREAVLSGVIELRQEGSQQVERVDYPAFEAIRTSAAFDRVEAQIARGLAGVTDRQRAEALTGNDLFDTLALSDERLFAGVFDNLFAELDGEIIDAYRDVTPAHRPVLDDMADYIRRFTIADDGTAAIAGFDDETAARLAQGAAAKLYGITKTVVAEGRYGADSDAFWAWAGDELGEGDSLVLPVDDESSILVAGTQTAQPISVGGNAVARTATFTRADGAVGTVADVTNLIARNNARHCQFGEGCRAPFTRLRYNYWMIAKNDNGSTQALAKVA